MRRLTTRAISQTKIAEMATTRKRRGIGMADGSRDRVIAARRIGVGRAVLFGQPDWLVVSLGLQAVEQGPVENALGRQQQAFGKLRRWFRAGRIARFASRDPMAPDLQRPAESRVNLRLRPQEIGRASWRPTVE